MNNTKEFFNKNITVSGFVDTLRDLQYVQFLVIRNGKDKLQVTLEKENKDLADLIKVVSKITLESTVTITGLLIENEKVKLNGMELIPSNIIVTSQAAPQLPINIKEKDNALRETRLDYRFLDLRREDNNLFFKCQTYFEQLLREYWLTNDYIEIHSPKISGANAEGGAEVFKLDYFGQEACLSQSPQLYKQMAMASGFNKVFEIGQVFRAENSHTSYHATEILMIDAELSWINNVEEVMDMQEELLKYAFTKLKEKYDEDIKKLFKVEISDVTSKFPRITLKEAKNILQKEYNYNSSKEDDLDRKEEELLCKWSQAKHQSNFIFITEYPLSSRPFYTMAKGKVTESYDLLFKGIEITSGAQREHRYDILKQQIIDKGIDPDTLSFYLDFFKYGCPPHGGFGIGLSRLMMQIFAIDNIREATFIYRGPTRLNP